MLILKFDFDFLFNLDIGFDSMIDTVSPILNSLFASNKKDEKIRGIAKILNIFKPIFGLFLINNIKDNIFYFLN